jgi:sirohydrochlorin ferrochelatase
MKAPTGTSPRADVLAVLDRLVSALGARDRPAEVAAQIVTASRGARHPRRERDPKHLQPAVEFECMQAHRAGRRYRRCATTPRPVRLRR